MDKAKFILTKLAARVWKKVVDEEMEEHSEEQQFDPDRKGADALKAAGYVEKAEYLTSTATGGYFCATCNYMKEDPTAKFGTVCTKLGNAEDAPWGCCNIWEPKH